MYVVAVHDDVDDDEGARLLVRLVVNEGEMKI